MVRYAQEGGDDSTCRTVILRCLGDLSNSATISNENSIPSPTKMIERDVTSHVITVTKLVLCITEESNDKITQPQLVNMLFLKKSSDNKTTKKIRDIIQQNPPNSDLTPKECERLIVSLFLLEILVPIVKWNRYSSSMYIMLGSNANRILDEHKTPIIHIKFPISNMTSTQKKKASIIPQQKKDGWISTKKKTRKITNSKRKKNKDETIIEIESSSNDEDVNHDSVSKSKRLKPTDKVCFDTSSGDEYSFS